MIGKDGRTSVRLVVALANASAVVSSVGAGPARAAGTGQWVPVTNVMSEQRRMGSTVLLPDGRVLTGVPRDGGGGVLIVGDETGREYRVRRQRIEKTTASRVSLMPEGLDKSLGAEKLRNLMTFLLT